MYISFWSPFIDNVATVKAVKNTILSIKKFSTKKNKIDLINFFDEWGADNKNSSNLEINFINYFSKKLTKFLPKGSFIKSRLTFILMFFLSLIPLYKYLKKNNPDYLIIQLLSSLPLVLLLFFNFNTKFILRISGLPHLNFFRKFLWKLVSKKIFKVTTPTADTYKILLANKIFDKEKIIILKDPIFSIREISIKKKVPLNKVKQNYFLNIGRLTKQKNHQLLIKAFTKFIKRTNSGFKLLIIGDGEKKNKLNNLIKKLDMQKVIFLLGYKNNPYKYIYNAECIISSSLWEDPGFVMIESAALRKIIISSDCPNGPKEFIEKNQCGYLFKNGSEKDLEEILYKYFHESKSKEIIESKKINALKKSKNFSLFNHYKNLLRILNYE